MTEIPEHLRKRVAEMRRQSGADRVRGPMEIRDRPGQLISGKDQTPVSVSMPSPLGPYGILREFVEGGPYFDREYSLCLFCESSWKGLTAQHDPDCLWVRAKEALG